MHAPSQIRLTFNQDHPEPHEHEDEGAGLAVQESKPVLQPPPLYKVVLFNDDYTPMDFVVEVLEVFFNMDREKATKIMLTVHTQGKFKLTCTYIKCFAQTHHVVPRNVFKT